MTPQISKQTEKRTDDYNQIYGEKDLIKQYEQGHSSAIKQVLELFKMKQKWNINRFIFEIQALTNQTRQLKDRKIILGDDQLCPDRKQANNPAETNQSPNKSERALVNSSKLATQQVQTGSGSRKGLGCGRREQLYPHTPNIFRICGDMRMHEIGEEPWLCPDCQKKKEVQE